MVCIKKKVLNLLKEESVSRESSARGRGEVLPQMFEKVSRSLKYDSIYFCPQTYIQILYI